MYTPLNKSELETGTEIAALHSVHYLSIYFKTTRNNTPVIYLGFRLYLTHVSVSTWRSWYRWTNGDSSGFSRDRSGLRTRSWPDFMAESALSDPSTSDTLRSSGKRAGTADVSRVCWLSLTFSCSSSCRPDMTHNVVSLHETLTAGASGNADLSHGTVTTWLFGRVSGGGNPWTDRENLFHFVGWIGPEHRPEPVGHFMRWNLFDV